MTVATAYPSISEEAQATAEDVKEVAEDSQGTEEDARILADFAPRTVIADDMAGYSSIDISFPIPAGCAATAATLTCQGVTLDLSAVAIDNAGTPLTSSTSVNSSSIKLKAPVTSSVQYPIFATLVASDPAVPEAADDFKETMEWSLGSPNDYDSEADLAQQEAELEPEPGYDPYDGGPVVLEPYVEAQGGRSYVAGPQLVGPMLVAMHFTPLMPETGSYLLYPQLTAARCPSPCRFHRRARRIRFRDSHRAAGPSLPLRPDQTPAR